MLNQEVQVEKDRVFRYIVARFSSLGPSTLDKTREHLKEKMMKSCGINEQQYDDLFKDLCSQNNWDDIETLAYLKTITMF
jgi:hypothetical protein